MAVATSKRRRSLKRRMARWEVAVAEDLRVITRPSRTFQGQCYRRALSFVLALDPPHNAAAVLVHGWLDDGLLPHAWVELWGGMVFDGVMQRFYGREAYYSVLQARKDHSYTCQEVARLSLATVNYGPWTDAERGLVHVGNPPPEPCGLVCR